MSRQDELITKVYSLWEKRWLICCLVKRIWIW